MTGPTRFALLLAPVLAATVLSAPALSAPAHAKPRPKDPDGHYVGHETPAEDNALDTMVYEFDVSGHGRKVKNLTVRFNAVCSYPLGVQYVVQPAGPMKIDKRGRFHYLLEQDSANDFEDIRLEVTGRLKGTEVKQATFSYAVGYCSRGDADDPMDWVAKRTRRSQGRLASGGPRGGPPACPNSDTRVHFLRRHAVLWGAHPEGLRERPYEVPATAAAAERCQFRPERSSPGEMRRTS
jgi:hypothetical protein